MLTYAGPGFEVVPHHPTLTLGDLDDLQEPAFQIRGFIYNLPVTEWLLKNRGGGLPVNRLSSMHSFYSWLPPEKYFKAHPEWYALHDGKRQSDYNMGICGTNEELAQELANQLMARMAEHPDSPVPIQVAQGDGFTGCQCPECRKLVAQEGSEIAPLLLMLNRALEITSKKYPHGQVITFAYYDTLKAPKTLRPHPNLWINIVSSALSQNQSGDQLGRIRDNPANRDYQQAIEEWGKIAPGPRDHLALGAHRRSAHRMAEYPQYARRPAPDVRFRRVGAAYAGGVGHDRLELAAQLAFSQAGVEPESG